MVDLGYKLFPHKLKNLIAVQSACLYRTLTPMDHKALLDFINKTQISCSVPVYCAEELMKKFDESLLLFNHVSIDTYAVILGIWMIRTHSAYNNS